MSQIGEMLFIKEKNFRLMNKRTREEYILEYFGMMDDADYSRNAVKNNRMPRIRAG